MKLNEVAGERNPFDHKKPRAGVYPVYIDESGQKFVYMMVPSQEKFGGTLPQMGKGGIDDGETPEQAALREGREELGLRESNVENFYQLADKSVKTRKGGYQLTVFVAEVKDMDAFDPHGYEAKWSGWVELEEAVKVSRPNQQQFIEMISEKYANVNEEREWIQDPGYDLTNPLPIIQDDDAFELIDEVDAVLLQMYKDEKGIERFDDHREYARVTIMMREREGTVEEVPINQVVSLEKYLDKEHVDALRNKSEVKTSSEMPLFYKQGNTYYAGDGNHRLVAAHLDGKQTVKGLVLHTEKFL